MMNDSEKLLVKCKDIGILRIVDECGEFTDQQALDFIEEYEKRIIDSDFPKELYKELK